MAVTIEQVTTATSDAVALIQELEAELAARYPPEQRHGLSVAQVFAPNVRFFVARVQGSAAGCGAVALFDDYAEVKRMYTRPAERGRGVAKALLGRIEAETWALGRPLLRLETGTEQAAAVALYERCGFLPCGAFGPYAKLPAHRIATSLFYEKRLAS